MDESLPTPRPMNSIGGGLQHERTALAWERTAIAMMVAGVVLARYAATGGNLVFAAVGVAQTAAGGALLLWAGINSDALHSPATPASAVPQVALARTVGLVTIIFTAAAFLLILLGVVDHYWG